MTEATTEDGFLNGRLTLRQPARGFRAGMDAVLLAAATPAMAGERVLDLGCGVGTAALCLGARVPDLALTGLERAPALAALARENAARNALPLDVVEGDIAALPASLRALGFDHVIANPPFHDPSARSPAPDASREAALAADRPLADWIAAARARTASGGTLTLMLSAARLDAALAALAAARGASEVLPLAPRPGRAAHRVLIRWRKGAGAALTLWPPVILHPGSRHAADAPDHAPRIEAVMRGAAPFPWPGPEAR